MSQISQVLNLKSLRVSRFWLPITFVLITGGLLVAMIFIALVYQVIYLNRIYPGVVAAGIEAGGMTEPQLTTAVTGRAMDYLSQPITIHHNRESWVFTGQELGMRVDVAATVSQAYAVGRQGNLLVDMLTQLTLWRTPRQIDPIILYDTGPSNQVLYRLTDQINYPPQNAQLIIHPDASIEIIPSSRGRQLHLEATRIQLEETLFSQNPQPVQTVTQEILPPIPDVATARQQAENLLSDPIILRLQTDTDNIEWRMEPQIVAGLLDVVEKVDADDKTRLYVEPNLEKFRPYIEDIAQAINQEPVDAQLSFDPEANELVVLQESSNGRALDTEAVYQQLKTLAEQPDPVVRLSVTKIPSVVSSENVESLGIKELVSESTSYFKGSNQGRMHNIALAASKFHGVVIPPGEVFSFNQHLGEVSKENGFDESLIIYGNRTTVGIGGGVCQVSTTAFRTAFFGGFELIERWAHGYRVSWYETNAGPGLDATIYTPEVDLKFRNDTGHYLLIQTETDLQAGTLTFRFYGTNSGREVIVSEPELTNIVKHGPPVYEKDPTLPKGITKQIDWPKDGLDVTVTRTVKAGDVIIHEDVIESHYRPWRAVYKVGTSETSRQ
jgi:vancomycin resistance protein YoaR